MTKIVTEFGKFRYNHLSMIMCALGDIFQEKVDKLLDDKEGVSDTLIRMPSASIDKCKPITSNFSCKQVIRSL